MLELHLIQDEMRLLVAHLISIDLMVQVMEQLLFLLLQVMTQTEH